MCKRPFTKKSSIFFWLVAMMRTSWYAHIMMQHFLLWPISNNGKQLSITVVFLQNFISHFWLTQRKLVVGIGDMLQCWFKLSGQNEEKFSFQTRFSQFGLRLDKKRREQKLPRISSELKWCNFFSKVLNQNFTPGHFCFFQLIKDYAETALLIDEKYISHEDSYRAQQSSTKIKSPR